MQRYSIGGTMSSEKSVCWNDEVKNSSGNLIFEMIPQKHKSKTSLAPIEDPMRDYRSFIWLSRKITKYFYQQLTLVLQLFVHAIERCLFFSFFCVIFAAVVLITLVATSSNRLEKKWLAANPLFTLKTYDRNIVITDTDNDDNNGNGTTIDAISSIFVNEKYFPTQYKAGDISKWFRQILSDKP